MSGLTWRNSGVARYREKALFQSASFMGGSVPMIGCHSVIDRPEWVNRVTPPTTTIANTSAQHRSSHAAIARAPAAERAGTTTASGDPVGKRVGGLISMPRILP